MQRYDADSDVGTGARPGRGGWDRRRGCDALGAGAVSRPGSPEGAPMRAADAASRDGRGGADQDGLGGTASASRGEAAPAGAGTRRCGSTGSGSVRERERGREKGKEGTYVR